MLITQEIENQINIEFADFFQEIPAQEDVLFEAKSKLKDAYNLAVIMATEVMAAMFFVILSINF